MKIKPSVKAGATAIGMLVLILVFSIGVKSRLEPTKRENRALRLDGDGDYVKIPDSRSLNSTKAITCECWVKVQSLVDVDYDVNMFLNKEYQSQRKPSFF